MLIAFEGPDLSGKSTLLGETAEWVRSQPGNLDKVVTLHSPGETELGKRLAKIVYESDTKICKEAMRFIMAADTAQMHNDIINPALDADKTVLVSRNRLSDYVYGLSAGIDLGFMLKLFELIPFRKSNLTFLCKCPFDLMCQRKKDRDGTDRFEADEAFMKRSWQIYNSLGMTNEDHGVFKYVSEKVIIILDTSKPVEDSMAVVKACLMKEMFSEP